MTRKFRLLAFTEAFSLLILLFIAMPLKYFYGDPRLVKIVGTLHGILFILYIAWATLLSVRCRWTFSKLILVCLVSSVPFGPFIFDRQLFLEEKPGRHQPKL
jgi:integral membrane protein